MILVVLAASQSAVQQRVKALLTVVSQLVPGPWVDLYVPQPIWQGLSAAFPSSVQTQVIGLRAQVLSTGQLVLMDNGLEGAVLPWATAESADAVVPIQFYGGFPVGRPPQLTGVLSIVSTTKLTLTAAQQQAITIIADQIDIVLTSGASATELSSPIAAQSAIKNLYQSAMRLSMGLQRCLSFEDLTNQLITHLPQELPLQAFELTAQAQPHTAHQICLWPTASVNVPSQDELACSIPHVCASGLSQHPAPADESAPTQATQATERSLDLSLWRCYRLKVQNRGVGILKLCLQPAAASQFPADSEILHNLADQIGVTLYRLILLRKLQAENLQDPLTHLFNRRHLMEVLGKLMKRVSYGHYQVGFIMLDLDHFKHLNDTYGHDAGDQVLRMMGLFLKGHARPNDVVCRFGGEEFALILPGVTWEILARRAEQLCRGIHYLSIKVGETPLKITLSAGFAIAPLHGKAPSKLIKAADEALYTAKRQGRDRAVGAPWPVEQAPSAPQRSPSTAEIQMDSPASS